MTLIAVAPNKMAKGVLSVEEGKWLDKNDRPVKAHYAPVELVEALERHYLSDAHFVTYIIRDHFGLPLVKQPRINKPALGAIEAMGYTVDISVLVCDVDNPGHAEWTSELRTLALEQHQTLPMLSTAGVYATQHGRRILQPLAKPMLARDAEPYVERWLSALEAAGVGVDWSCRDWTRHFRLPHVQRSQAEYRSPWVQL